MSNQVIRFGLVMASCLAFSSGCSDGSASSNNGSNNEVLDLGRSDATLINPDAASSDATTPDAGPDLPGFDVDVTTCWQPPLQSSITNVQPMTGIVLWEDGSNSDPVKTTPGNIQLEYAYVAPSDLSTGPNTYDWSKLDQMLDRIAGRKHQGIIRFYYTYPGRPTAVPAWLKALPNYNETTGSVEGKQTGFPDWSSQELQAFHVDFYTAFAARYDQDPRVAFLQTGFGLWAEYHIYEGPNRLGNEFPSKAFQEDFLSQLPQLFPTLPWSLSIDSGSSEYSSMEANSTLRGLKFGLFDDSFMHERHDEYNEEMWALLNYETRFKTAPHGGEFSYYTDFDQEHVLDVAGIHGRNFAEQSEKFHISYMIGNDQPDYQTAARIKEAGMQTGYRFAVKSFETCAGLSRLVVENQGVAPIYHDAFIAVNGARSSVSLKGLSRGETRQVDVASGEAVGGNAPVVTIQSDRLVAGQVIEFSADL